MSSEHRRLVLAIRIAIVVILLAAAFKILLMSGPGLALSFYARGKKGTCTFSESVNSAQVTAAQIEATERIRKSMRMIGNDPAGLHLWETLRGRYWVPAESDAALQYDLGEQERKIYGSGDKGVRPGDVVLDCGANVGVFSKEALALGAKLVVAIEPGPENLECLRRNLSAEIAQGRVLVYPKGVWNKDDVLMLSVDSKNSARDSFMPIAGATGKISVPLTTIDKLAAELNLSRVDFIKMDIEGAEQKAIAGARQTIQKYRPRMALCVYHTGQDPVMVPRLVRELRPDYHVDCQCFLRNEGITPEVAHFY